MNQKRIVLTDEQFANLREAANNFVLSVASGWDMEVEEGKRFDDALIEYIVKPFIEPLINKELRNLQKIKKP
jgi:DNA-binding GntR family transcriptional regulator